MKENINTTLKNQENEVLYSQPEKALSAEEENKELKKRIEELKKNTNRLFTTIAHDLRSPFQAILGMSEILSQGVKNMSPEEIESYTELLNTAAKTAFDYTHGVLLWGKTQIGGFEATNQTIDLGSQVNNIIKLLQQKILDKKINLIDNIKENTLVFADVGMLENILVNILSNAIKFSNVGGEISMSFDNNKIIISDNGIGIPPERLVNFFGDIGNTRCGTKGEKGTGLGMNLSKEFAEKMGGDIKVESEEGKGTTFVVTLPEGKKE